MKRLLVFMSVVIFALGIAEVSTATTFTYLDRPSWEVAVGGVFTETASYGTEFHMITSMNAGYGETLSFDGDMEVLTIGSGWQTWSGSYGGQVLYRYQANAITGTFGSGNILKGFGFEVEPNSYNTFPIVLSLSDGTSLSQDVYGLGNAAFYGWTTDTPISSFTLSCNDSDFAVGRFASSGYFVPIPATILLLGSGLAGMAAFRRKFKK